MHWQRNLKIRDTEVTSVATIMQVLCSQFFFIHFLFKGISFPHQTTQKTSSPQVWDMTLKRDTGGKELVLQYFTTQGSYFRQPTAEFILFLGFAYREEGCTAAQDSEKSLPSFSTRNSMWGCSLLLISG